MSGEYWDTLKTVLITVAIATVSVLLIWMVLQAIDLERPQQIRDIDESSMKIYIDEEYGVRCYMMPNNVASMSCVQVQP
jgi:hypothetical protein